MVLSAAPLLSHTSVPSPPLHSTPVVLVVVVFIFRSAQDEISLSHIVLRTRPFSDSKK